MRKEMLINAVQPEECRIAILENNILEELYVERTSHESYVGNIYKGRVVNIEPSIQAAFVDFGVGRNGFLHVSDVEPAYYRHLMKDDRQDSGRRRGGGGRRQRSNGGGRPAALVAPPEEMLPDDEDLVSEEIENLHDELDELDELDTNIDDTADVDVDESETNEPDELEELVEELDLTTDIEADVKRLFTSKSLLPPIFGEPTEISVIGDPVNVNQDADESDTAIAPENVAVEESEEQELETDANVDAAIPETKKRRRGRPRKSSAAETTVDDAGESEEDVEDGADHATDQAIPEPNAVRLEKNDDTKESLPMDSVEHRTKGQVALWQSDELEANEDDSVDDDVDFSDADLSFSLHRSQQDELADDSNFENADSAEQEPEPTLQIAEIEEAESVTIKEPVETRESGKNRSDRSGGRSSRGDRSSERSSRGGRSRVAELEDEEEYIPRRSSRGRRPNDGRRPGRPGSSRPKPLIQDIFKKGQEVLVQVIKEGIGTKGPTLSTYISIAGRYLVLMPGLNRIGVSRKITDEEKRRRLRDILVDLKPPKGLGFIIRTAGFDRTQKELQRDLSYLSRLWEVVVRRIKKCKSPAEIYQESDMITRTIRDTFTSDIQNIWVDDEKAYEHAREFLQIVMPRYANRIKHYQGSEPIFHKHGLEQEIGKIQEKNVPLPNGGSIVIEQTEALVAIDVNSGNFRAADNNAEETAYQMNLLAAKEIARQLRLRDMGGVIVNDFIDMRDEKHRRNVERALRDAVKRDRARTKILRMSAFGIIEMTRQRIRPSLKRSVYTECSHCKGGGQVKTCESVSIDVMRLLQLAATRSNITQIRVRVSESVSDYLLNRKRPELVHLEDQTGTRVEVVPVACAAPEFLDFKCSDNNGNEIAFPPERRSNESYYSRNR